MFQQQKCLSDIWNIGRWDVCRHAVAVSGIKQLCLLILCPFQCCYYIFYNHLSHDTENMHLVNWQIVADVNQREKTLAITEKKEKTGCQYLNLLYFAFQWHCLCKFFTDNDFLQLIAYTVFLEIYLQCQSKTDAVFSMKAFSPFDVLILKDCETSFVCRVTFLKWEPDVQHMSEICRF